LKKLLFISLAVILALSVGLIGCDGGGAVSYDLTIAATTGGSTTPAAGTDTYDEGEVVDLTATPDDGYVFVNWTGDVDTVADVNDATTTITMDDDYSITANFAEEAWDYVISLDFHCTAGSTSSLWEYVHEPWIQAVQNAAGPDGGKFEFTVTFGETPYGPEDSLTALSDGVVDVGQLSTDTFNLGAIGYLPFIFSMSSAAYATHSIYEEDWDVLGELDDVKMLLATPLQPAQWWGNVDVQTLADLDGLDVRAEGKEVPIIDALGATPQEYGTMEIFSQLDTGAIDGCFFTYSGGMFWLHLNEVTTSTSEVNMVLPRYMLAMNKAKYESLHPDARALLDSFCTADDSVQYAQAHEAAQAGAKGAINGYRAGHGQSPIYVIPAAELENWEAACESVFDDFVTELDDLDFDGQGILDRVYELIAEYEAS
jgi:uncharacterized repeat protein (TIGR02543 family)